MKRIIATICLMVLATHFSKMEAADAKSSEECITCHEASSVGLYKQWKNSAHAKNKVGCVDCHGANEKDADAFEHYGFQIATIVTPKDCAKCHPKEAEQVGASHHAKAGQILESQDAYMAHVVGGHPAAIQGCENCHGAKIKIDPKAPNKLSMETWPNSGIGRINPDGSLGACNSCHTRHSFSRAQARQPEACSKCHLGPDHPQKEIYEESKHGNAYHTHINDMNLKSTNWVVGVDYFEAPTCATCHMSATESQPVTHDVGNRISWTLRPVVSVHTENWQAKRKNLKDVCSACHAERQIDGHFYQYDATVRLYNEKFAKPATAIMDLIKKKKLLESPASFGNEIEWIYWELWHHEGRRARHGASMMGPDYTWWHGIYEVGQHFYFKFLPEARKLKDPDVNKQIDELLAKDPMHQWLNTSSDELKKRIKSGEMQKIYQNLFKAD